MTRTCLVVASFALLNGYCGVLPCAAQSQSYPPGAGAAAAPPVTPASIGADPAGAAAAVAQGTSTVSTVTSGLLAEYHMNEATGATSIIDYSGNSNNATVFGSPTFAGGAMGGITFSASSSMILPAALNAAQTFQFYTCTNGTTTLPSAPAIVGSLYNSSGQYFGVYFFGNPLQGLNTIGTTYPLNPTAFDGASTPVESGEALNGCEVLTWVRGTSADRFLINTHESGFYQYQTAGTSTITPYAGTLNVGGLLSSGGGAVDARFNWPFPIYEVAAYSTALTNAQAFANAGALASAAQRRGIAPAIPAFGDAGASLLAAGDSITYGYNGAPYTNYLSSTATSYVSTNMGTPTYALRNMLTECPSRGYGLIPVSNAASTVIIWGGTNDIMGSAITAATPLIVFQRLQRTVACYHQAPQHPRVFVITMIDRGGTGYGGSTGSVLHDQLNAYIRGGASGADGVIDVAGLPMFGADGSSANPSTYATACNGGVCFNTDDTHPKIAGDQYVIGPFVAGMLNFFDSTETAANPKVITAAYTETTADVAVAASPATASFTITLPAADLVTGTARQIVNVQASGANTVTVAPASGDTLIGLTTVSNGATVRLRSVLGSTPGLANAAATAGAHWETY
jgi:hypothetical protein